MGVLAGAALVAVALLGGLVVQQVAFRRARRRACAGERPGAPFGREQVEHLLASLDDQPVDPTKVQLVSTVSTFADCDALIGDLRRVGAEHVGSRGFGGYYEGFSRGAGRRTRPTRARAARQPARQLSRRRVAAAARPWAPTSRSRGSTSSTT